MIELACPGCGHGLRIKNRFAGLKGKCKYCGSSFKVPFDITLTPGQGQPALSEESVRLMSADNPGEDGELPFGGEELVGGDEVVVSSQPGLGEPEHPETRKRARVDDVPLVDPGAGGISAHRYGRRQGGLGIPMLISTMVIICLFGFAFWLITDDDADQMSTSIDHEVAGQLTAYSTITLNGVDVAVYGNAEFSEGDFKVPESEPLSKVSKNKLIGYAATITDDYKKVVSDYQLALTELGWDMMIIASDDSTELYGNFKGKDASLLIETTDDGVRVVLVTGKE